MDKKEKQRYDYDYLQKYCQENNVELLENYSNVKLSRDVIIRAKCLTEGCENDVKKGFKYFIKVGSYCDNCSKKKGKEKAELTTFNKYGVKCSLQADIIKSKTKITMLNKYGVEYPSQSQLIRNKIISKNIANYGVEFPLQSKDIREKCKDTLNQNFGVNYSWESKELKEKSINTMKNKYGVENATQSHLIKNKIKATNLEKYGVICSLQSEEIKEKTKNTCLNKYGVVSPNQNAEISEKQSKNAYKSKEYIFPSGRTERIQGYEHFMLDELLKQENISEDDITVNRKEVPTIWYEDANRKQRRYFVDCFIKSQNRCIETKSTWTAKKNHDFIFLKQKALQDSGYICEIWIYNQKGEKVECYK